VFTHFATADWADPTYTLEQLALFNDVLSAVRQDGIHIPIAHAANSAATMRLPQAHFDAVRPGIAIYGMHPSSEWPPTFEIRPVLTLKSKVSRVRQLPAGAGVSYSRTFITDRPTLAALVPVGYGDGYHRLLSNKGRVLIRERPHSGAGVRISSWGSATSGVPVMRWCWWAGKFLAEVAEWAGTINYEVTTSLLGRVVRAYRRGGEIVGADSG
jgi:alanine racemase